MEQGISLILGLVLGKCVACICTHMFALSDLSLHNLWAFRHLAYVKGSIYNASKYAIHGFTSAARFDLMESPVRVTHISPGLVGNTEFSNVRLGSDEAASAVYDNIVPLDPVDVADNVLYALTRPLHVQIADILMYATNQAGPRDVARVGEDLGLAACLEKAKAAADGGR